MPAIEVALGRVHVRWGARAAVDEPGATARGAQGRSTGPRGCLMDEHDLTEADAFSFIQQTAMRERTTMRGGRASGSSGYGLGPELNAEPERTSRSTCGEAPPARRQLADLPGVLRPADRHGDRVGPGHERRVRVHVDAHQPAAGPPARRHRASPSTGPSRRSATSASPTTRPTGSAAPDILRQQIGLVRQVVETLRHPDHRAAPGFEADDIIATLATQARDQGDEVVIVTGDRDSLPARRGPAGQGALQPSRRQSDYALYDEAGIEERTGVTPAQYPQYAALRGDPSDNLPGVPGVGEKTAAKLINTYGDLDGIFANVDKQTPKLRASLAEHEESVRQNADVMVLVRDVPLDVELDDLRLGRRPRRGAAAVRLPRVPHAFDRLAEALDDGRRRRPPRPRRRGARGRGRRRSTRAGAAAALADAVGGAEPLADRGRCGRCGRAQRRSSASPFVTRRAKPARWPGSRAAVLDDDAVRVAAQRCSATAAGRRGARRQGADARAARPIGVDLRTSRLDTMLAAYLLDPAESRYLLGDLARPLHRRSSCRRPSEPRRAASSTSAATVSTTRRGGRVATRWPSRACAEPLKAALERRACATLYDDDRGPSGAGARPDGTRRRRASTSSELQALNDRLGGECAAPRRRRSGRTRASEFNVNSTHAAARDPVRRARPRAARRRRRPATRPTRHPSRSCAGQHPIIDHLLRYREVEKLRVDLRRRAAVRGRAPTAASTPRSTRPSPAPAGSRSEEPNLHNIPVRSETAGSSARRSCRARLRAAASPTTTRSSCAASPTSPRIPG